MVLSLMTGGCQLASRGCNPVVCYDGARLTARSFCDMKKSASLLVSSLIRPTRLLTLSSQTPMLTGPRRSIEQAPPPPPTADATTSSAPAQPPLSATPLSATTTEQPLVHGTGQAQQTLAQAPPPSESQTAESSQQLPVGSSTQHQHTSSLDSGDVMARQLSLDAAKEQHVYHSWPRGGKLVQLQGNGPMVNAQTIPARGANADGVSACRLHISVRRHYKEKGKQPLPLGLRAALHYFLRCCLHLGSQSSMYVPSKDPRAASGYRGSCYDAYRRRLFFSFLSVPLTDDHWWVYAHPRTCHPPPPPPLATHAKKPYVPSRCICSLTYTGTDVWGQTTRFPCHHLEHRSCAHVQC